MDFSERKPLARRGAKRKFTHMGPMHPQKAHKAILWVCGARLLMSKMRKISIAGGFWECDCRVWCIYRYTDKQMHSY